MNPVRSIHILSRLTLGILMTVFLLLSCAQESEDVTPPVITLLGPASQNVQLGTVYVDPGYQAIDDVDGDISDKVVVSGNVNMQVQGDYTLRYNVEDEAGNQAEEKERKVKVLIF